METVDRVIEIIDEYMDINLEIDPTTNFSEDSGIGSFDQLMIVNAIEDAFNMEFSSEDYESMKTVEDIAKILDTKYLKNKKKHESQ